MLETSVEVHTYYVDESKRIAKGKILKTDLDNEAINSEEWGVMNNLDKSDVVGIEIDEATVDLAKKRYPHLSGRMFQGDVREIEYGDTSFDTVLDLSTLDHVDDYKKALLEYKRVLKPGGQLLLFVWTAQKTVQNGTYPDIWWAFSQSEIEKFLNNIGTVLEKEYVYDHPDHDYVLRKYIVRKNEKS